MPRPRSELLHAIPGWTNALESQPLPPYQRSIQKLVQALHDQLLSMSDHRFGFVHRALLDNADTLFCQNSLRSLAHLCSPEGAIFYTLQAPCTTWSFLVRRISGSYRAYTDVITPIAAEVLAHLTSDSTATPPVATPVYDLQRGSSASHAPSTGIMAGHLQNT